MISVFGNCLKGVMVVWLFVVNSLESMRGCLMSSELGS